MSYISTPQPVGDPRARGRYSHTLPIRVCAAQRGRDFEAPDLELGIHFRGVSISRANKEISFLKKQGYFNLQTF